MEVLDNSVVTVTNRLDIEMAQLVGPGQLVVTGNTTLVFSAGNFLNMFANATLISYGYFQTVGNTNYRIQGNLLSSLYLPVIINRGIFLHEIPRILTINGATFVNDPQASASLRNAATMICSHSSRLDGIFNVAVGSRLDLGNDVNYPFSYHSIWSSRVNITGELYIS